MSHIADMGAPATGNVRSKLLGDRTKQAFDLLRRNFSGLLETAEVEVRIVSCTCPSSRQFYPDEQHSHCRAHSCPARPHSPTKVPRRGLPPPTSAAGFRLT
eukprot:COSAG01_NODE_153_length_23909_cov_32.542018_28_plen_101_part_00